MSEASDPDELLDLLGDEYVRTILTATSREAMSAKQLSEECGFDRSTVYRRVDDLVDTGLLEERTEIEADGSHHSVYAARVEHVDVDLLDGELDVELIPREGAAGRFTQMWEDMRRA